MTHARCLIVNQSTLKPKNTTLASMNAVNNAASVSDRVAFKTSWLRPVKSKGGAIIWMVKKTQRWLQYPIQLLVRTAYITPFVLGKMPFR